MQWDMHLPEEYRDLVGNPVRFERHEEASAKALKVLGFDVSGKRCFYFHEYILTEECLDEEETVFEIPAYHERVFAWNLKAGGWLKLKAYTANHGDCGRRSVTLPIEMVEERDLGR